MDNFTDTDSESKKTPSPGLVPGEGGGEGTSKTLPSSQPSPTHRTGEGVPEADTAEMLSTEEADDVVVVVAGGDGRHSAWLAGWGVTRVVTEEITTPG